MKECIEAITRLTPEVAKHEREVNERKSAIEKIGNQAREVNARNKELENKIKEVKAEKARKKKELEMEKAAMKNSLANEPKEMKRFRENKIAAMRKLRTAKKKFEEFRKFAIMEKRRMMEEISSMEDENAELRQKLFYAPVKEPDHDIEMDEAELVRLEEVNLKGQIRALMEQKEVADTELRDIKAQREALRKKYGK